MFELIKNGFLFGFIDNGIVVAFILGAGVVAYFAVKCPEARRLVWRSTMRSAHVGALGNALSDFVGATGDPTMWDSITGITAGCLSWTVILLLPKFWLTIRGAVPQLTGSKF